MPKNETNDAKRTEGTTWKTDTIYHIIKFDCVPVYKYRAEYGIHLLSALIHLRERYPTRLHSIVHQNRTMSVRVRVQ